MQNDRVDRMIRELQCEPAAICFTELLSHLGTYGDTPRSPQSAAGTSEMSAARMALAPLETEYD